jgi:hypothetical protein
MVSQYLSVSGLLDFAVQGVLPHDGVVFFQLHTIGRILAVFLGNVARRAWQAAVFVLSAFQNNLDAVASTFLCHDAILYFSIPKDSGNRKCEVDKWG